jgi:hypothetical protein
MEISMPGNGTLSLLRLSACRGLVGVLSVPFFFWGALERDWHSMDRVILYLVYRSIIPPEFSTPKAMTL